MNIRAIESIAREKIFPMWDRKKVWQIRYGTNSELHRNQGICDDKKRLIITNHFASETHLLLVMIHEICHAIVGPGHGKLFLKRLSKAASKATEMGYKKLSKALNDEFDAYANNGFKPTAKKIYGDIENALADHPNISFANVVKRVSMENGMSEKELLLKYRRAKRVFEERIQK